MDIPNHSSIVKLILLFLHTYLSFILYCFHSLLDILNEVREERANDPKDNWVIVEWDEVKKETRDGREWSSNDNEESLSTRKTD